ncbi:MAG TPA: hypothetical protein VEB21_21195 [Terriglobales bacterium]|nr:hypothetical protein [Terriglobales bacterium]
MVSRRRLLAVLSSITLVLRAGPAWAPFHLVVIEEVFFGTPACPEAQYVMLRTIQAGQTLVAGQMVNVQTADGSAAPAFGTFTAHLPNSGAEVAMIIGTAAAEELFGIAFDAVVEGDLAFPDGRVCFGRFGPPIAPVDCVAYGNFTGDNSGHGAPAAAPPLGMALVRIAETDEDSTDFVPGEPSPENNAGEVGELGECGGTAACVGDCNGDGEVTVDEIINGVTFALGEGSIATCPALDSDGSGSVTVDEIVTAVNNALDGCP